MSIKIYYGFKIASTYSQNLVAFNQELMTLKSKVREHTRFRLLNLLAGIVIENLATKFWMHNEDIKTVDLNSEAWSAIDSVVSRRKAVISSNRRDPAIDFEFSLQLYNSKDGDIIGVPYFESFNFHDIFKKSPLFEEFAYWDNVDKPKTISSKNWKNRREAWMSIDDSNFVKIELSGLADPYDLGIYAPHVTSHVQRILRYSKKKLKSHTFDDYIAVKLSNYIAVQGGWPIFQGVQEYFEWKKKFKESDEYRKAEEEFSLHLSEFVSDLKSNFKEKKK